MKHKWMYIIAILISLTVLAGCEKGERYYDSLPVLEPIVAEYYESIGITDEVRKNALAVYQTVLETEQQDGVKVRLPEYAADIYYITVVLQNDAGYEVNRIVLSEKYNADKYGVGVLLHIHVLPYAYYEADPWFQETPFPSTILGSDEQYVYMLQIPSDVQYNHLDELATALYKTADEANEKFISDFIEVNNIKSIEK